MASEAASVPRTQLWQRRWQRYKRQSQALHDRFSWELRFSLKLMHYKNDRGETEDRRFLQFKGRELFSTIRRIVSDVDNAPRHIEATANVGTSDPAQLESIEQLASDTTLALKHEVDDPQSGFGSAFHRAILSAACARRGVVGVDYVEEVPPYGRMLFRYVDPRKLFWPEPWQDWFDPTLPHMIEECDIPLDALRKMKGWRNTDRAIADSRVGQADAGDVDESGRVTRSNVESDAGPGGDETVKVLKCWTLRDDTIKTRKTDRQRTLPQDQRYLACDSCGYRSPAGPGLPESGGLCPDCLDHTGSLNVLQRVDQEVAVEDYMPYFRGRLEIIAANQDLDFTPADDRWPHPARAYPYWVIKRYEHPIDVSGISETTLAASAQVASNAAYMRLYTQSVAAPNVVVSTGGQLKDATGQPFIVTDEAWQFAYIDGPTVGQPLQQVQMQANPALVRFIEVVQQNLRADMGVVEFGVASAEDIKSITATTAQQVARSGSVPTENWLARIQREMSVFLGVASDIQRSAWTEARWIATFGDQGSRAYKLIRGVDLPECKFQVTSDPQVTKDKVEQLRTMIDFWGQVKQLGLPPEVVMESGKLLGMRPEFVKAVLAMSQAGPGAGTPGVGAAGSAAPPPNVGPGITPGLQAMAGGMS